MDPHSLKVLEFGEVRRIVSRLATCGLGQERVLKTTPFASLEDVEAMQEEVREATHAMNESATLAANGLVDTRPRLDAAARGAVLEPREFLEVRTALSIFRLARRMLSDRASKAPRLSARAEGLADLSVLETHLRRAFDDEGEMQDEASPQLASIRRNIRVLQGRIQSKMASFLRDQNTVKMLQEPIITTREDRYVLPIRSEYRGVFPGLVLDASASGATVFMEPFSVVDLGNDLRQARMQERHEIEAILRDLSSRRVGSHAPVLLESMEIIEHLDAVFAAARYGIENQGNLPRINEKPFVRLIGARHPLLRGDVVPTDIEIGQDFHTLVITGPNTGGKTVTLKTLGLLALMALCGWPIPAQAGSSVSMLRNIFADIGDEQAIVQNLSTFSSHVSQIVRFLPKVDENTLVLMDELGTGTDPREGTSLAVAILEYLHQRQARTVVTTHYGELKSFGAGYPGAMNASVEFDEQSLRPTYRLLIGVPGRSCALIICHRLGMPEDVVARARELMGEAHFEVEELVADLEQRRDDAERRDVELHTALVKAQQLQGAYEEKLKALRSREASIIDQAVKEGAQVVEDARDELRAAIKEARQNLSAAAASVRQGAETPQVAPVVLEESEKSVRSHMEAAMDRIQAIRQVAGAPEQPTVRRFGAGDRVRVRRLSQEGSVIGPARGNVVQVLVGSVKMSVSPAELEYLGPPTGKRPTMVFEAARSNAVTQSLRLDLRGFRADDAVYEVEKFLDQAARTSAPSIAIIHGKGQGILRKFVHDFLKVCPVVETYRLGDSYEGGSGVTVVVLK